MRYFFTRIFLFTFVFSMPSAFAANVWHTSKIKTIYPVSDGDFIIIFKSASQCTDRNQYHRVFVGSNGIDAEGSNKLYSAALAAAAMGKTVSINFDDSSSNCFINRMKVNY